MSLEASRGAGSQSVPIHATGCVFDPHSRGFIYISIVYFFALVSRQSTANATKFNSSTTQHEILPELGRKWGTEWLNSRFPINIYKLTLPCPEYSVKLFFLKV